MLSIIQNVLEDSGRSENSNRFIYKHNNGIKKGHIRIYIHFRSCLFHSCFSCVCTIWIKRFWVDTWIFV